PSAIGSSEPRPVQEARNAWKAIRHPDPHDWAPPRRPTGNCHSSLLAFPITTRSNCRWPRVSRNSDQSESRVATGWLRENTGMSPRCYPPEPVFGPGRAAERRVWEVLCEQLPGEAALLHSVAMIERAAEHEADLVVAWPGIGVAVVEVKGGQVSRRHG